MTVDLDRLRELAREPERTPMLRTGQFPTMTAEILRQKQEISAIRRGLLEAIEEIEKLGDQICPDCGVPAMPDPLDVMIERAGRRKK